MRRGRFECYPITSASATPRSGHAFGAASVEGLLPFARRIAARLAAAMLCLFLGCLFLEPAAAQPSARTMPEERGSASMLRIDAGLTAAPIEPHLEILRDPSGTMSLDEVAFGEAADDFTRLGTSLSLGYIADPVWLRLRFVTTADRPELLFLDLRPAVLDDVRIFVPRRGKPSSADDFETLRLGDHVPIAERAAVGVSLVAPLHLPAGAEGVLYLRIETTSTMALRGVLRSPEGMATSSGLQALRYGVYQTVFGLMAMVHLFTGLWLRSRTYLAYGAFLSAQALLCWCNSGLVPPEWLAGDLFGVDDLTGVAVAANLVSGALFVSAQIDARQHFPFLRLVLVFIACLGVAAGAATLFDRYQAAARPVLGSAVLVFGIATVCNAVLARRRRPGAVLAAIACAVELCGVVVTSARLGGLIAFAPWSDYAYETGSVVFTLYMSIALALRAAVLVEERRLAREEALATARSAERYALDLVEARTFDLAAARDAAQTALAAEHETQQSQIRFVDVIAHQYRTPLAVVSSSLSALERSIGAADDGNRARIDRARRAIGRLVEIVDITLHRSRLDGAAAKPKLADVPIGPFLRNVAAQAVVTHPERSLALEIEPSAGDDVLRLDADMIALALANLIENAMKFSSAGSVVTLQCSRTASSVSIAVTDTGIGIPDTERDLLTHKFFRASNSGSTLGMGLGLFIAANVAAAHDASIAIESHEGQGTTVTLTIPFAHLERDDVRSAIP